MFSSRSSLNKKLKGSNRTPFSSNGQHTWLEIPVVMVENVLLSFLISCQTSVAVMTCIWLSPFCVFSQSETICNLHLCYRRLHPFLSQSELKVKGCKFWIRLMWKGYHLSMVGRKGVPFLLQMRYKRVKGWTSPPHKKNLLSIPLPLVKP